MEPTSTLEQKVPPRYIHSQARQRRHNQAELRFHRRRHSNSNLHPWRTTLLRPLPRSQLLTERRRRLLLMKLPEEARRVQSALGRLSTLQCHMDSSLVCRAHLSNHSFPDLLRHGKDRHHTAACPVHRNTGRLQVVCREHTPDHSPHHHLLLRLVHRLFNIHLASARHRSAKVYSPLLHHRTRRLSTASRHMVSQRNNSLLSGHSLLDL